MKNVFLQEDLHIGNDWYFKPYWLIDMARKHGVPDCAKDYVFGWYHKVCKLKVMI